ncbi:MAG: hypothetical protein WCO56_19450 [Verrucomicrobiota bacterium]
MSAQFQVRRATVDDLPQLIELWKLECLPWEQFERRLTEFQVVVDADNIVQGTWGIQIATKQAQLYGEVFLQSDQADQHRDKLWERLQSIVHNHALVRLWTCESAPYWRGSGFRDATGEQLKKLPGNFTTEHPHWLVLELREEHETTQVDMEKEFEVFKEQERLHSEAALQQAKGLKTFATVLAFLLFAGVMVLLVHVVRPDLFKGTASVHNRPAANAKSTPTVSTNSATNSPATPAATNNAAK